MQKFTFDIETRSPYNLKEVGLKYTVASSTQVVIASLCNEAMETISYSLWEPDTYCILPKIKGILEDEETLIYAHNSLNFDVPVWESKFGKIKNCINTLGAFAPYLNQKVMNLAEIASQFGGAKDDRGKELIEKYSKPLYKEFIGENETAQEYLARMGKKRYEDCFRKPHRKDAIDFREYCEEDTKELMKLVKKIPHNIDLELDKIDKEINFRGIRIDFDLAEKLLEQASKISDKTVKRSSFPRKVLSSEKQFREAMYEKYELELEKVNADYLEAVVAEGVSPEAEIDIYARLELSKRCDAKIKTILKHAVHSRLFCYLLKDGAHTGRWASKGAQLHNFPGDKGKIAWKAFAKLQKGQDLDSPKEIQALTRFLLLPDIGYKFRISDYAGIEARIAAWLVDDFDLIEYFRSGKDVYIKNAATIYQVDQETIGKEDIERTVGKVATLGCGYGMGEGRFIGYAASWSVMIERDFARKVIEGYRDANEKISGKRTGKVFNGIQVREGGVWKDLQNAFKDIILGKKTEVFVAKCRIYRVEEDIFLELPSGRNLFYRNCNLKLQFMDEKGNKSFYQKDGKDFLVTSLESPLVKKLRKQGYSVQITHGLKGNYSLYGGKLLENICQAVGACLLRHGLKQLYRAGFHTSLHVHDEVLVLVKNEEEAKEVDRLMAIVPEWAKGLPIDCEGFTCDRFAKSPCKIEIT